MTVMTAKWSLEDYHRMIAAGILAGRSVELLQGEVVEMASEGIPHAFLSDEGSDYLQARLGDRARIREAKPITLPNASEPEPDLAIVAPQPAIYRQHHPYPENIFWLIEFADTSLKKDLETKTTIYAEAGILEYWVVNLKTMQLIVFRHPVAGTYQSQQSYTNGVIQPLAFPDVDIQVEALLGDREL